MPLRGQKAPNGEKPPRLRCYLYGPGGVGKTIAAITGFPRPYIIDTESGCEHYRERIASEGGAVYETTDLDDAMKEIRALASEEHEYLTLVIDPLTILSQTQLLKNEKRHGQGYGRHITKTRDDFEVFARLIKDIDMNVVVVCHMRDKIRNAKDSSGQVHEFREPSYDSGVWEKLEYTFDLGLLIERGYERKERYAVVTKTRFPNFLDQERFLWSAEEIAKRYGQSKLWREVERVSFANEDQIATFQSLLKRLSKDEIAELKVDKILAEYPSLADMPSERINKGCEMLSTYFHRKKHQQPETTGKVAVLDRNQLQSDYNEARMGGVFPAWKDDPIPWGKPHEEKLGWTYATLLDEGQKGMDARAWAQTCIDNTKAEIKEAGKKVTTMSAWPAHMIYILTMWALAENVGLVKNGTDS